MRNIFVLLTVQLLFLAVGISQTENDFQTWNTISISKKISDKYKSSLTIIQRINDDNLRYNDASFDWKINRKIKGGLSGQITFRHWTFTRLKPVYFFLVRSYPCSKKINLQICEYPTISSWP